jgi:hypothetical protein
VIALDHTHAYTTVGRTPLDEGSARRRDLYLTTQTLYKTNGHGPGGIRTHDPSKRAAADPHFRPRGHCLASVGYSNYPTFPNVQRLTTPYTYRIYTSDFLVSNLY